MSRDAEKDGLVVVYVNGYPSLADFIASDHDHSSVIYKRFDRLSSRNILYLQSELAELERRQDEFDREDLRGDLETKKSARDWVTFLEKSKVPNSKALEKMQLVHDIRAKIKEYSRYPEGD